MSDNQPVRTALFFGSFNPIHNGHLAIVRYVLDEGLNDEVWLVVSPRNPLKEGSALAPEGDRLEMARIAVKYAGLEGRLKVSDAEFSMPRPSYTIDTLERLRGEFPERDFSLLMGADILDELERWKDWRKLLAEYRIMVYPRPGYVPQHHLDEVMLLEDAPVWDYSSTRVRNAIKDSRGGDMIPEAVMEYIKEHKLWS